VHWNIGPSPDRTGEALSKVEASPTYVTRVIWNGDHAINRSIVDLERRCEDTRERLGEIFPPSNFYCVDCLD